VKSWATPGNSIMVTTTPVNFASGSEESYVVRYSQDLTNPFDLTYINAPYNVLARDIFGNSIDFNKDGLTDSFFINGQVTELLGYTQGPGDTVIGANRLPQSEIAFGDGRSGNQALRIINDIGPDGTSLSPSGFPNVSTFSGVDKVAVFDINGDGYQDLFTWSVVNSGANSAGGQPAAWLYNPASATFSRSATKTLLDPGLGGTGEATFNDFNGDGAIDMVWTDYRALDLQIPERIAPTSYTLYFGETNGAGGWSQQFGTSGTLAPITFDIDTIPRAENLTTGSFEGTPDVTPVARDFNGDGKIDMAIGTQTGIRVYTNPGNGRFDPSSGTDIAGLSEGFLLKAADFNNDGLLDLVSSPNSNAPGNGSSSASISLYLNNSTAGAASFKATSFAGLKDLGASNGPIATGDMNLDGAIDLVLSQFSSDSTRFYVALGEGNGNFASPTAFTGYSNLADPLVPFKAKNKFRAVLDIDTGDFNGDGQLDVLTLAGANFRRIDQELPINHIYGVAYNRTFTPPSITTTQLPAGQAGVFYSTQLQATGGDSTKPYSYQLNSASPALPDGLSLQPDGTISGIPQRSGSFTFLAEAAQANGLKGSSSSIGVDFSSTGGGPIGGGPIGGGPTAGDSIITATKKVDRLAGTSSTDVFLFPNIQTGANPKTKKLDKITGYQDDLIKIKKFDEEIIGESKKRRQIFNSYGTIRNLTKRAINELLGDAFKPRDAAVFQVQGRPGSYLAVNKRGNGFNYRSDMLVYLPDFVPSSENPLTLM
jgi:hypothetical protein